MLSRQPIPTIGAFHATVPAHPASELALTEVPRAIRRPAAHDPAPALRALDAIHLAAAIDLSPIDAFVSYDERQGAAVRLAGLRTVRSDGYLLAQGGVHFARSLVETGLIDEYRLVVHPVILGGGERLFAAPLTIEPVSSTAFSSGAVAHVFAAHP